MLYGIQIGLETAFLLSRTVLESLCGLQAWLINRFFVFHGRFGTILWVPRLVSAVFWNVRLVKELTCEILICLETNVKIPNPISKLLCLPDKQFSMCPADRNVNTVL